MEALAHATLLGGFDFRAADGTKLLPNGRKSRGIVAILLLERGNFVPRSRLIDMFWHDRGKEQAQASLRQSLRELRKQAGVLADDLFVVDRESVAAVKGVISTDLMDGSGEATAEYRGDLLDGLDPVSPVFDDWLEQERRVITADQLLRCERLLAGADRASGEALWLAEQVLKFDPCHEHAALAAMQSYAERGEASRVVGIYSTLAKALKTTGFPLSDETQRQFQALQGAWGDTGTPAQTLTETLPVLAIHPIVCRNVDASLAFLSDSVVDEIIARFAEMPEICVLSHEVIDRLSASDSNVNALALRAGAGYLLRGSLLDLGDSIRCNFIIAATDTGATVQSLRRQISKENLFQQLGPLADSIASSVLPSVERAEHAKIADANAIHDSLSAYEHYLRAKHVFLTAETEDYMDRAEAHLETAVDLSPDFAPAYVHLIQSLNTGRVFSRPGLDLRAGRIRALDLAGRLLKIDARNSNAHIAWCWCLLWRRQFEAAERSIRKAIDLKPYESHRLNAIGTALLYLGYHGEAEAHYEMAQASMVQDLDFMRTDFDELHYITGAFDRALSYLDFGENRASIRNQFWRCLTLAQCGAMSEARMEAESFVTNVQNLWSGPTPFRPMNAVSWMLDIVPLARDADREIVLDGLRKLGFDQ